MRILFLYFFCFLNSCSDNHSTSKSSGFNQNNVQQEGLSALDSLLLDTPKILKLGRDYVLISTQPSDHIYFGKNFSPYKMELYQVALIERVIDSLLNRGKQDGFFKKRSVINYKYQIFSVRTAENKIKVRVEAFCVEEANDLNWSLSRVMVKDGGECYFNLTYDLIDKRVIEFQINGDV